MLEFPQHLRMTHIGIELSNKPEADEIFSFSNINKQLSSFISSIFDDESSNSDTRVGIANKSVEMD